jgi:hypothetical protein
MKPRHRAKAAALLAITAALRPDTALAAKRACLGMSIEPDVGFRAHWPDLLDRIQSELSARADVDACARVDLRLEGDAIITVSVTLPDGRVASRRVTEREDVIPMLQALLLVPELPPAPAAPPPTPAAPRDMAPSDAPRTERDEPLATRAPRNFGVELSLITGARMGDDGQLGVGAGALSFLEINGWLIGFEGRVDAYRPLAGGDAEPALELAILGGRRLDLGSVALDLSAGPAVVMKGFDSSHVEVARMSAPDPEAPAPMSRLDPIPQPAPHLGPLPRLLLAARLGFSPRSVFRTFLGIDGEVGPTRASHDPASARLPAYSLGFSLGASVGTP